MSEDSKHVEGEPSLDHGCQALKIECLTMRCADGLMLKASGPYDAMLQILFITCRTSIRPRQDLVQFLSAATFHEPEFIYHFCGNPGGMPCDSKT